MPEGVWELKTSLSPNRIGLYWLHERAEFYAYEYMQSVSSTYGGAWEAIYVDDPHTEKWVRIKGSEDQVMEELTLEFVLPVE